MKRTVLSSLLALAFSLALLAAAVYVPGTAEWVMRPLMEHFAPPEDTHLPAEEYGPVVGMITRYLQGDEIPFQHVFLMNGAQYAAFNAKEQHHMADVQSLFHLCRTVGWTSAGVAIALAVILRRTFPWRIFRRTLIAILAAVTAVIILACIDFDSLFILFHQLAFANDLWLLDPKTDLLIRLMPLEFFISYAAIISGLWLLGMAGLLIYATYRIKITKGE